MTPRIYIFPFYIVWLFSPEYDVWSTRSYLQSINGHRRSSDLTVKEFRDCSSKKEKKKNCLTSSKCDRICNVAFKLLKVVMYIFVVSLNFNYILLFVRILKNENDQNTFIYKILLIKQWKDEKRGLDLLWPTMRLGSSAPLFYLNNNNNKGIFVFLKFYKSIRDISLISRWIKEKFSQ